MDRTIERIPDDVDPEPARPTAEWDNGDDQWRAGRRGDDRICIAALTGTWEACPSLPVDHGAVVASWYAAEWAFEVPPLLEMSTTAADVRPSRWRSLLRVLMSLAAVAGLGYWVLFSFVLALIQCGDTCDGADASAGHWRWTAQFMIAAVGAVSGVIASVLGFTSRARMYRRFLLVSLGCVLAWLAWVLGFGAF